MRFNNVEMMADNQIINEVLVIFFLLFVLFCRYDLDQIRSDRRSFIAQKVKRFSCAHLSGLKLVRRSATRSTRKRSHRP